MYIQYAQVIALKSWTHVLFRRNTRSQCPHAYCAAIYCAAIYCAAIYCAAICCAAISNRSARCILQHPIDTAMCNWMLHCSKLRGESAAAAAAAAAAAVTKKPGGE